MTMERLTKDGSHKTTIPQIDREYIEIYPVNWRQVDAATVKDISSSRSHDGLTDMSLYFHIPFCQTLCPFCKFNIVEYDNPTYKAYIQAILKELESYREHPDIKGRNVTALYFGGGTGSMISPDDLSSILGTADKIFQLDNHAEVTVESHPNTLSEKRLQEYRKNGVNRVSIGIQSFQDENLGAIGRNHSAQRNMQVLDAAQRTGFDSVAIDIMYRLPRQTLQNLEVDLEYVKRYQPDGLSVYSLGIEDTQMKDQSALLASDAEDKQFFYHIREALENMGYQPFMQPDYAKPGKESKYVTNAWRAPQQLMLSFGAGAHTHYFAGHNWANIYPIHDYMKAIFSEYSPIAVATPVPENELMAKYMVLGVRAIHVDKKQFQALFGRNIDDVFGPQLQALSELGWIRNTGDEVTITREGLYYVDNISKYFYTKDNAGESQPRGKNLYHYTPANLIER